MPQSVKDALADAETLRMVARDSASLRAWDLGTAQMRGESAATCVGFRLVEHAAQAARDAAHSAFRAVPELRESR